MANFDAPRGFMINGPLLRANLYYKDASVILGIGDPVVRAANSSDPKGFPEVTRATTGAAISGVVIGFEPDPDRTTVHLAAADAGYVIVADHPDQEYLVQDNGGASGLIVTQIGQHIDSVAAINANTSTGISKYELDTEAVATDNTWTLMRLAQIPGNVVGANAKWIVKANLHTEANASASRVTEI